MQPSSSSPSSTPSPSFLERLKKEVDQGGLTTHTATLPGYNEVPQDTAEYDIYDTTLLPPSPPPPPSALPTLLSTLLSSLPPYLSTYLWHSEGFSLHPSLSSPLPHLSGSSHFSHCLDDLYLLTCVLFHLSSTFPSLLIRLIDSDGHFLLIDVAHALPPSLSSPEGLDHRVWITGGELHIIPVQVNTREEGVRWMMAEMARGGRESRAPPAVQTAVRERLVPYPDLALRRNRHRVRCLLPVMVARVLREDESVVGGVVAALDARDLIDVRVANKMAAFLPSNPFSSVVPVRVRFTQLLYAQAESQVIALPRSLQSHPALAGYASLPSTSPMRHAWTLGVKLMLGMEMLLAHLRAKHRKEQTEQATLTAARAERETKRGGRRAELLKRGPMTEEQAERELRGDGEKKRKWRTFLMGLEKVGWFEGTERGEELWKQQLTLGLVLFEEEEEKRKDDERREEKVVHAMSETERRHLEVMERVLGQNRGEAEERKEVESWAKWEELEADDSDEWLRVDMDELEAAMSRKAGVDQQAKKQSDGLRMAPASTQPDASSASPRSAEQERGEVDEERLRSAGAAVSGVKGFLSVVSSHEGAELPSGRSGQTAAAKSPPTAQRSAVRERTAGGARHQRLMAALDCDESGIEAAVRAYEADYGQGSFDADLMANIGRIHLDADQQPQQRPAQGAVDEKKAEAHPHQPSEEEDDKDVDIEEGDEEDGGEDEGEGEDMDEELLFGEEKGSVRSYLASMNAQLRAAGLGSEFARRKKRVGEEREEEEEEEGEEDEDLEGDDEVDEDLNLLQNLLDSFANQHGAAGPVSNLLGAMGLQLPNKDETKQRRGKD